MAAKLQVCTARGAKVTELFANGGRLARLALAAVTGTKMIIKSPSQNNHLAAGAKLFVAVGEEGDRGGVGLGGVRLGGRDHAVFVAH